MANPAMDMSDRQNSGLKEYEMTDGDFRKISSLAGKYTGIVLGDHKRDMVYGRIARRVRKLGMETFAEYLTYLENNPDKELSDFINAITTNLTSFFREGHHFHYLKETVFPELKKKHMQDQRIRIWSAGCSTGMETYSIAITLRDAVFPSGWDVKILATDLDSEVLRKAKEGIYVPDDISELPEHVVQSSFLHNDAKREIRVKDSLKKNISFKRLNLLERWPMKGPFDVIFCRNVVIYFDKPTQKTLFNRYADMLAPGGYLFIGHSENLNGISDRFENLGNTIYRKIR